MDEEGGDGGEYWPYLHYGFEGNIPTVRYVRFSSNFTTPPSKIKILSYFRTARKIPPPYLIILDLIFPGKLVVPLTLHR